MAKFGVSFYSYQWALKHGRMTVEDCLRAVSELPGADGIELLATQTPPADYPYPKKDQIEKWKELLEEYKVRPVCFDSQYPGYTLPQRADERETFLRSEIDYASKLGFPMMRIAVKDLPIVERCLGYAEDHNVMMNLEIHVPMTITGQEVTAYAEMIDRTGTSFAGIMPDMAIFQTVLPRRILRKALYQGADPQVVEKIEQAFSAGENMAEWAEKIRVDGLDHGLDDLLFFSSINVTSRPEELRLIARYITHFHAKFYHVEEDLQELGVRYDRALPILKELGYTGYLCSEYEEHRMYFGDDEPNEIEQVRLQHEMMHRYLD